MEFSVIFARKGMGGIAIAWGRVISLTRRAGRAMAEPRRPRRDGLVSFYPGLPLSP